MLWVEGYTCEGCKCEKSVILQYYQWYVRMHCVRMDFVAIICALLVTQHKRKAGIVQFSAWTS